MVQSISLRRDGDRIILENRERTKDNSGVLSAIVLSVEDAEWIMLNLGRLIMDIRGGGTNT